MTETHSTVSILILLLLTASAVAIATKFVRLPYTLALVIVGLVISPMHFLPNIEFSPDVMLLIFLPALLFEAAWNLNYERLKDNLAPILILAVFGVLVAVAVEGYVVHWGVGLPLRTSLLFGATIAATDPVSVLALFRKFGLPPRLSTIVEGESLLNDGTAVVVFKICLALVVGTTVTSTGQLALTALRQFAVVVFGGLAVGAIIGMVTSAITAYIDDHLLEITLTTIAAYGSYLLADSIDVSPVIAVLTAGLVVGNFGRRVGMSATTQLAVNAFWEYAAFVVNSLVFLLIGLVIHISTLFENAGHIAWAVGGMLLGRFVSVYGLMPIANRFGYRSPWRWMHVLYWGGMRGALSIALVLSLPAAVAERSEIRAMMFGTVIYSLLVHGLTMESALRWLGFGKASEKLAEYELLQARMLTANAAVRELENLRMQGSLAERLYERLHADALRDERTVAERVAEFEKTDEAIERQELNRVRGRVLKAQQARLTSLLRDGVISEKSYWEVHHQLDGEAKELESLEG